MQGNIKIFSPSSSILVHHKSNLWKEENYFMSDDQSVRWLSECEELKVWNLSSSSSSQTKEQTRDSNLFIQDHGTAWQRSGRFSLKSQRIESSLPRACPAGAEVPRQNSQLWELILGNYNPGDSSVQGSNTGSLWQDQFCIYLSSRHCPLLCTPHSTLSTLHCTGLVFLFEQNQQTVQVWYK